MVKSFTDMSSISIGRNKIAQRVNGKVIFLNETVGPTFRFFETKEFSLMASEFANFLKYLPFFNLAQIRAPRLRSKKAEGI